MTSDPRERLRRLAEAITARPAPCESLDDAPAETLFARARDAGAPTAERQAAIGCFLAAFKSEPAASDLLLELFDDANESVALFAIDHALPFDDRQRVRLTAMLDDPRPRFWSAAAEALARRKQRALLPIFLDWLRGREGARRAVGLRSICWILNPHERLFFLNSVWEQGWAENDDERLRLAEQYAAIGNPHALAILASIGVLDDASAERAAAIRNRFPAEQG